MQLNKIAGVCLYDFIYLWILFIAILIFIDQ